MPRWLGGSAGNGTLRRKRGKTGALTGPVLEHLSRVTHVFLGRHIRGVDWSRQTLPPVSAKLYDPAYTPEGSVLGGEATIHNVHNVDGHLRKEATARTGEWPGVRTP